MAEAVARRLLKELKDYQKEPNPDLAKLSPISDDNILVWNAVLRGESDTPYEGGHWTLLLNENMPSKHLFQNRRNMSRYPENSLESCVDFAVRVYGDQIIVVKSGTDKPTKLRCCKFASMR
ncbi:unnamed protein product [Rhizophagus irregularis]|nr:unnamed protein product [Rhizophagus irregularis]